VYAKRRYSSVAFVASCIAELYGDADAAIGYRCAFVYVRQLALGVRAALANRDAKQVEKVLCWRFLNAAKCWTSVLARGSNGRADRFGPLVFPLCQVLFGAIELAQSPKHAPLRLHCCKALHTIAGAAEVYVPTTAALLQTLEESKAARTSQPAKKGKSKDDLGDAAQQVQLLCSLNDDQMKLRAVRDEVAKYTCDLLGDYLELLRYSPAVPELSLVPMVALKA
ncbi:nucleolar complex protein 2, partial [Pelagophyceae sp. CCMP2097]